MGKLNICFVKVRARPSFEYRARQLIPALRELGANVQVYEGHYRAHRLRGSVAVFVKFIDPRDAAKMRAHGNKVVLDTIDFYCIPKYVNFKIPVVLDGAIFPSSKCLADKGGVLCPAAAKTVIHHHSDGRIVPCTPGGAFKIGYFGIRTGPSHGCELLDKLPQVGIFESDWFSHTKDHPCHFTIRSGTGSLYKPSTKLVFAAACGANIITTRDSSFVDLIGNDYPFYTNSDIVSVMKTIEQAKEAFNGRVWTDALSVMRRAAEQTTIRAVAEKYIAFLKDVRDGAV